MALGLPSPYSRPSTTTHVSQCPSCNNGTRGGRCQSMLEDGFSSTSQQRPSRIRTARMHFTTNQASSLASWPDWRCMALQCWAPTPLLHAVAINVKKCHWWYVCTYHTCNRWGSMATDETCRELVSKNVSMAKRCKNNQKHHMIYHDMHLLKRRAPTHPISIPIIPKGILFPAISCPCSSPRRRLHSRTFFLGQNGEAPNVNSFAPQWRWPSTLLLFWLVALPAPCSAKCRARLANPQACDFFAQDVAQNSLLVFLQQEAGTLSRQREVMRNELETDRNI